MAYFTSLWKARVIEKYRQEYENEKINSLLTSKTEIPQKTIMQRWRFYGQTTKRRMTGRLKQWFPDGSSVSNLYFYLKSDHTLPSFVLKSLIGFVGGIVLTYICFIFFVCQLSISLLHATIMSSCIGVLLTLGLAFSSRMRCLVFLLIPQLFSRVGRYTLTCYALILILTGPATNTLRNSEVLTESMACSQEQIKTNVRHITENVKKPFSAMRESIKLMVHEMKRVTSKINSIISKIGVMVTSMADTIQSSYSWLNSVADICTQKFGTPYEYCLKAINRGTINCRKTLGNDLAWLCNNYTAKAACLTLQSYKTICIVPDYVTTSFAATLKRRLRNYVARINSTFFINVKIHHTYFYSSNDSSSPSQIAAGIVTEIRKRADPLLTWLSWSSCITSSFLLLIIFRAKYYQHMFETRSRFDNRYVTKELRELDFKRYKEKRETVLPLNRRERAKYICISSFRLVSSEKLYLTRSMVFMAITTFKLLIHMVADYSLYWVLMTMRYHGGRQTPFPLGPSDAGVYVSGSGIVRDFIKSLLDSITLSLLSQTPTTVNCLPNPYPPDLQRYMQIAILIVFLWFFAIFEPYGLRFRHVIMGHYQPDRAKTRAVWLYNHILRTRGSFMKLARRKLHREYKYLMQENLTFRYWLDSMLPCWCLRYICGTLPKEPHCLLCNTFEELNDSDTKLTNCDTLKCPGVYCIRCFSDIGRLCTICMSPKDYGDMSDVSLEKGSSDESDDSDGELDIKQKKLKGTEKEKLIRKSKSGKTNKWKITSKKNENEDFEDVSLLSYKGEYKNSDKNNENNDNSENIIRADSESDVTEYNMIPIIENGYINESNLKIEKDDDEKLFGSYPESNNSYLNRSNRAESVKELKSQMRYQTALSKKTRNFHPTLRNKIAQCFQRYRNFMVILNIYNIKTNAKVVQVYKVAYHIRIAKYLKIRRKIRKINLKRKKRKRNLSKRNISQNNQNISNIDSCIQKSDCKNNNNDNDLINQRTKGQQKTNNNNKREKPNKQLKKFKKHKYHIGSSCRGIKRFLKCYSNYLKNLKTVSNSKKRNEVNYQRQLKNIKADVTNKTHIFTNDNSNARSYRIFAYLFYRNWFKIKFNKDPVKEKHKHEAYTSNLVASSVKDNDGDIKSQIRNVIMDEKIIFSQAEKFSCNLDKCAPERNSEKLKTVKSRNAEVVVLEKTRRRTKQHRMTNNGISSSNSELYKTKEYDDAVNKEESYSSKMSEPCSRTLSTITLSSNIDSDKTTHNPTVNCKEPLKKIKGKSDRLKAKSDTRPSKRRISNETKFWDVTLKSDWWSPMPERRM